MSDLLILLSETCCYFILGQRWSITLKMSEEIIQTWIWFSDCAMFLVGKLLEFVRRSSLNSRDFY